MRPLLYRSAVSKLTFHISIEEYTHHPQRFNLSVDRHPLYTIPKLRNAAKIAIYRRVIGILRYLQWLQERPLKPFNGDASLLHRLDGVFG